MKAKSFSFMSLVVALSLSACSSAPSAEELAKEQQIAELKANVCRVTKVTGKDTVNGQDKIDVFNNGVVPTDPNEPSEAEFWSTSRKWSEDLESLIALVGPWTDPVDGTGWLESCNS